MYFKIALNNVKKSFKDYGIYFLTLTFAVCIFYAFNSIGSQEVTKHMNASTAVYMKMVKSAMSGVSVFVSIILGGLIIYANNFLIKRRKKELGIYMMLGMAKKKISQILVVETFLIGLISLIVGLILGIIISQGLSVFTAKLFELNLAQYTFSISIEAIIKTIIYFGIIFVLVMIFNVFVINKYKLIDLLTAMRKNEKIKLRNPIASFIVFIIGVGVLIVAYYLILTQGVKMETMTQLMVPTILGFVGTFLFFFGISGFILYLVQRNKKVYLKGLNIFVTKQISSKMTTNFISMSLISLMLFVTIVALSSGLGFKNVLQSTLKATTPFNGTVQLYAADDNSSMTMTDAIKKLNIEIPKDYKYSVVNIYNSKVKLSNIIGNDSFKGSIDLVTLSDYNNMLKLEGEAPVTLNNNEVIITSNFNKLEKPLNDFVKSGKDLNLNGKNYKVDNSLVNIDYQTSGMTLNTCTVVVPDNVVKGLAVTYSYLNINYPNHIEEGDKFVDQIGHKYGLEGDRLKDGQEFFLLTTTRTGIYDQNKGMTTLILYVTIYLGIIFLLTSAAVLALQQLSEASDSVDRYKSLRKIGVSNSMINKSVLIQSLIYFGAPLALAIIDSIVGVIFTNEFISTFGNETILIPALITILLLVIIYMGYFIATYISYKNIIREK